MSLLITGGGLVGSQIARLEQEAGRQPIIYDIAPNLNALADFVDLDRCIVVTGDVLNPLDLVATINKHDVRRIIHTAALGGLTVGSNAAPLTSTMVNVVGTAYVLEATRVLNLDRVVLCSSSTLYSSLIGGEDNGAPNREEAHPRTTNVYAANKQAVEDLAQAYYSTYGLDVVSVRYAAVFGPFASGGGGMATWAMEGWLRAAVAGETVEIRPFGQDWVYSKDAALGTHLACFAEGLETRCFNLGMGKSQPAQSIAAAIESAVPGAKIQVLPDEAAAPGRPPMSIDRAQSQLGFRVEYPMEAAIADYRDWMLATDVKD